MNFYFAIWFWLLVYVLTNVIAQWKNYPHWKKYSLQNNDPTKYCEGWICEYSGLSRTTIDQVLEVDNELRDQYAAKHNISNLYMLEWYPVLEYWAQDKADLCLPTTEDEFYDFTVIQKYGVPNHDTVYRDACQVVIVSEPVKIIETSAQQMKERIIDHLRNNRLKHFKRLRKNRWDITRKQASQIGCGYTLRLNKTHYIDHLVCLYGSFRFERKGSYYKETKGPPCTNCNYYKTRYTWRCGTRYTHLCVASITDENQTTKVLKKECKETEIGKKLKRMDFNVGKLIPAIEEEYVSLLTAGGKHTKEKKPLVEFFNLFSLVEGNNLTLMEDVIKARSFAYQEKPNENICYLCTYLMIIGAVLCSLMVALFTYVIFFQS